MCWECAERGSSLSLTPSPTPTPSSDYVRQQLPQFVSPFFTKLNHDIRQKIYHQLFGFLRVHVRYHERNDQSKRKHGWSYVLCQEEHSPKGCALHPNSFVRNYHSCSHTSETLESNLLYTCQQAYSEGRVALYGSATFVSRSPIDCIHFTKDIPRRSWPQNLEFNCTFRPELEHSVPLLDLLYWVVDDFRASKVKIWLAKSYYQTDKVSIQAQQNTIEALKHFLSYSKSDTTFILPSCFKPSVRNLTVRSPGKITFKFLEHYTSDEELELTGLVYLGRSYKYGYPDDRDDQISD
ncbi:hypothetical protein FPOA_08607 [Fusarium poae]|uniref:DUF7730 domain-containing protein n=1 Tax=Fusarium poae TaxID=36050 RepID=A0A1B8APG7_FUSPO|nr:hypothetical protein FPOA_08607 [Fusarium poae]